MFRPFLSVDFLHNSLLGVSMSIHRLLSPSVFVVALVLLVLAVIQVSVSAQTSQTLKTEPLKIQSGDTILNFTVEVAATEAERAMGLMYREEMAADHGMLFIFEGESERFFWMKNTPLPLDIIYISSAGEIVSIAADTTPFSEKVIPSGAPAEFVLELNAGTAEKLGIHVGARVLSKSMNKDPS